MCARAHSAWRKPASHFAAWADEDCSLEDGDHFLGDASEGGGPGQFFGIESVDLLGPSRALSGVDERTQGRLPLASDDPFDANFDDPIERQVEARHLQVDERQRRSVDRHVPRGPERRRTHVPSLPRRDASPLEPSSAPDAMTRSEPAIWTELGTSPKTGTATTRMMTTLEKLTILTRAA